MLGLPKVPEFSVLVYLDLLGSILHVLGINSARLIVYRATEPFSSHAAREYLYDASYTVKRAEVEASVLVIMDLRRVFLLIFFSLFANGQFELRKSSLFLWFGQC